MDYLLKASAILAICYFGYRWLLQRETFFNSNRLFLLIGQIIALLFPLIVIPIYVEVSPQPFNPLLISNISVNKQIIAKTISIERIFYWIYGLGVLFFFGKFMVHFLSLVKLIKGKSSKKIDGIHYVETEDTLAPFSFFNWVVYNPKTFKNDELQLILNHERVHVKQWHSIDVIFTQLTCIVFWFNPLAWYYKKALQQNLEFIADNYTQSKTDCKQSYQRLLLKASMPTHQLVMANNFYNSLIKKRILMLHTSKSNTLKSWKYALVIPALALFLMSFNTKTVYVTETVSQNEALTKTFTVSANSTDSELKEIESYFSDKAAKIKFTAISRNTDNTIKEVTIRTNHDGGTKFIKRMTVGPDNSETIKPFSVALSENKQDILFQFSEDEMTTVSRDHLTLNENVTRLSSKKILGEDEGLGENPLYIINDKQYQKADFKNRIYHVESITTINKEDGLKRYGEAGKDGVIIFNGKTTFETEEENNNLIAVITKDFSDSDLKSTQARFQKENVTIIFSKIIRNSKNEITGITINYESKVSHGNHFINGDMPINTIQLNLDLESNNLMVGNMSPFPEDANLLILLNDKEITIEEMNALNPTTIQSTNVITDKNQFKKYGAKGKDGVVIITTKNEK